MTLPASAEDFYKARKKRKNLQRIERRLNKEFDGQFTVKSFRLPNEVDRLCRDAEEVSRKTYQYAGGGGFRNNEETFNLMCLLADRGWLQAYILYIEEKPCAFEGGIYFDKTYHADFCGYDPAFKKFEIGTYLELKIIETLCETPDFEFIDFGWMDTAHKNRYCDIVWEEASFNIYQPSLRGLFFNVRKIMLHLINKAGNIRFSFTR